MPLGDPSLKNSVEVTDDDEEADVDQVRDSLCDVRARLEKKKYG